MSAGADNGSSRVLVADDDPVARQIIRLLLRREGCLIELVENGTAAVSRAREFKPDLVLLDVNMPDMSGFEVCRRLRADREVAEVPIMMLTDLNDREARLRGLEIGADDYITKPFDPLELGARVRTVLRLNRYRRVQEANRLAHQLEMAAAIQQLLLPRETPVVPGIAVATRYQSASEVGGDFFDFIRRGPDLYFVIADVSGHGVASAIFMSNARSALRSLLDTTADLARLAEGVNARMTDDSGDSGVFVSAIIGRYDPLSRGLRFANCGHPAPVILRHDGRTEEIAAGAAPLGLTEPLHAEIHETLLAPGDLLCMFTDGLIEAANGAGEMFGTSRVADALAAGGSEPEAMAEAITGAVRAFRGGLPLDDDCTLVLIKGVQA